MAVVHRRAMINTDRPPNLRVLSCELLSLASPRLPLPGDYRDRIMSASNPYLVTLRVLAQMLEQAGVPKEDIARAAAKSRERVESGDPFAAKVEDTGSATGRVDPMEVVRSVDLVLANMEYRSRIPEWFVIEFWPAIVRRLVQGEPASEREIEICMNIVSKARGEG